MLGDTLLTSRPRRQPGGCGYIVRGQSTGRYLPASPRRVLVMGHQVRSWRGAMPDNDASGFLSHNMEPIKKVLRVRVQVELELAHGVAAVRENVICWLSWCPWRFQDLKQAPLRFPVKGLHEGKALAGNRLLGFFTTCKREEALAGNDLEPALACPGHGHSPHRDPR